jgi:mannose-6-phosphate isomerase class I
MVIALTPFECMCGFRTLAEIAEHFVAYPEFRWVVDHQGIYLSNLIIRGYVGKKGKCY